VPLKISEWLRKYLDRTLAENETTTMSYPPPIAKTIGFELIEIGQASAALKMQTDPAVHGNPMGTVHGGVLCDIADTEIYVILQKASKDNGQNSHRRRVPE
jgi:acyl-coenzyme A thioesterase PaaI-like protein